MTEKETSKVELKISRKNPDFEESFGDLRENETKEELEIFGKRRAILDKYKYEMIEQSLLEMPKEMRERLEEELAELDNEDSENGVHFYKCQFYKIFEALKEGRRVEFEGFGPYFRDYFHQGLNKDVDLTKTDDIGLSIMSFLKEIIPELKPVSLYDEYNTWALNYDTGTPRQLSGNENDGQKIDTELSKSYKDKFKKWVESIMRSRGIINDEDTEGPDKDYLLLSESGQIENAKKLVSKLSEVGLLEGDIEDDQSELYFSQPVADSLDPRYTRILLRDSKGHWQCPALDASQFLHPRNREIVHLIILPKEGFEEQQDQVWEILHTLKGDNGKPYMESLQVHNIFFETENPTVTKESVIQSIRNRLKPLLN